MKVEADSRCRVFESGQYSDLKIKCGDKEFLVHKAIVCTQSKFLQAAIGEGFEVGVALIVKNWAYASNSQASTTGIINLSDHDVEDVSRMLSFLYGSHYSCPADNLEVHVGMYAMGDMFDLPRLSQYAKCGFKESLKHIAHQDPMTFISLISRVYESTPESDRGLRNAVVRNAWENYDHYATTWDHKDAFGEVLQSTWPFTRDLLMEFADARNREWSARFTW